MTTPITATKRKEISREMAGHIGVDVSYERLMAVANRHHISINDTRQLLVAMGYRVASVGAAPVIATAKEVIVQERTDQNTIKDAIPAEVIATILRGGIYKILDKDPDVDPSKVFVITTLDKFTRERDVIRKLLQGA